MEQHRLSAEAFSELVKSARKGSAAAFGQLYATIYRELYYTARASLRSEADAADAVSDAVLDAFQSIGHLRDENAFKAWMFRILNAKIKRKQREYAETNSPLEEMTDAEMPSTDFAYAAPELRQAMQQIPAEDRTLLMMQVLGGYQSHELAKITGGSSGTIRSKLTRIRAKLREILSDTERKEETV